MKQSLVQVGVFSHTTVSQSMSEGCGALRRFCGLPAFGYEFIDREKERSLIDSEVRLRKAGQVLLLTGKPGVGKTALVLEWANRYVAEHDCSSIYLDFVDYRGDEAHVNTAEVLQSVAGSLLGFDEVGELSKEEVRRAYLDFAAREDLLVVLDNVRDPVEIEDFVTNSDTSFVVATSTMSNMHLDTGKVNVQVIDMFDRGNSRKLLRSRLTRCSDELLDAFGDDSESAEADAILDYCDDYPIAITKCAEALSDKRFSLKGLSKTLSSLPKRDETPFKFDGLWDELFSRLSQGQRVQFASLGLLPGGVLPLPTLCGLWGCDDLDDAQLVAERFVDASLLDKVCDGPPASACAYSMFSFLKDYCERKGREYVYQEAMKQAVGGLVGYYRQLAQCIDFSLNDDRLRLYDTVRVSGFVRQYVDLFGASGVFEKERARLHRLFGLYGACNQSLAHDMWPIAEALWPMCHTHGCYGSFADIFGAAASMANADGRADAHARLLMLQARCYSEAGRFADAEWLYALLDGIIEAGFDGSSNCLVASLIEGKGTYYSKRGLHSEAISAFQRAEDLFKLSGEGERGAFLQELLIGKELVLGQDYAAAEIRLEALIPQARAMAKRIDEARVRHALGEAQIGAGHYAQGIESATQAAKLYSDEGFESKRNQSMTLIALGLKALGREAEISALPASLKLDMRDASEGGMRPSLRPFVELCNRLGISFG